MDGTRSVLAYRRRVGRGRIPLVSVESIDGPTLVVFAHQAVARDLGQDGGRRDVQGLGVSLHDGTLVHVVGERCPLVPVNEDEGMFKVGSALHHTLPRERHGVK